MTFLSSNGFALALLWAGAAAGGPAQAQDREPASIESAHRAFHLGQYSSSLALYERLAALGHAEAAERAGHMLVLGEAIYGERVRADEARARVLLRQAAQAGRPHATHLLGLLEASD